MNMLIIAKSLSSKLFPHNVRIVRVNDKVIHFGVSSNDNSAHVSRSDLPLLMSLTGHQTCTRAAHHSWSLFLLKVNYGQ